MNKRWLPRGRKRGIVVQFFDPNILEIIRDRCLKFGTFTYPYTFTYTYPYVPMLQISFIEI